MPVTTHECGCEQRNERFFECRYHEGYRDGRAQAHALLRAARKASRATRITSARVLLEGAIKEMEGNDEQS